MSFSDAVRSGFQQYVTFSGRAGRSEFWFWALFAFVASIGVGIVDGIVGTGGILQPLFTLATLLPGLAVAVRRLHDSGRSAWWLVILYVPIALAGAMFVFGAFAAVASIGLGVQVGIFGLFMMAVAGIVALAGVVLWVYVMVQPSQPGTNQYGSQPGTSVEVEA